MPVPCCLAALDVDETAVSHGHTDFLGWPKSGPAYRRWQPYNLVIRSADTAAELGRLRLGAQARARYGAPYATIHRADLQALLLQAVQGEAGVALVEDRSLHPNPGDRSDWDHAALGADLQQLLHSAAPTLQWLVHTMGCRRLWHLQLRDSVGRASQMRQGRVTLLGDAAHPMLPYLAQGADMAVEDALALGQTLATFGATPKALAQCAQVRWQRNARVQDGIGLIRAAADVQPRYTRRINWRCE